jgi:hypothetical protein
MACKATWYESFEMSKTDSKRSGLARPPFTNSGLDSRMFYPHHAVLSGAFRWQLNMEVPDNYSWGCSYSQLLADRDHP